MDQSGESKMDPWLTVIAQLLKSMGSSSSSESMRTVIQDEMKKSQNQETNEMLKKILINLEQKHSAELQDAQREKDTYKLENEFLKKLLQEISREKRSAEKSEKMKDLANHLAGLSVRRQPASSEINHQKQNTNEAGNLPWLDPVKGNTSSAPHDGRHRGRGQRNFHGNNFPSKSHQHNHNYPPNPNMLQNQNFMQFQNIPPNPHFQPNVAFQQMPNQQYLNYPNFVQTPPFVQNPNFPPNPNFQQTPNFQQNHNFQHSRGGLPNRYCGRGQRGNANRGRSTSVGRNKKLSEAVDSEVSSDGATDTSFHIQVTKVDGGPKWVSTENISVLSGATSRRGRGNPQGRGRGRGGNDQQKKSDGQLAEVKKNRKKYIQNMNTEQQNQKAPEKKNDEDDPEENCHVS